MAEFCEVMRQAARMCASHNNDCAGCGLVKECMECPLEGMPENWQVRACKLASIERIVMDWAAKNPEPRYPSWIEWQGANFQMAERAICAAHFMDAGDAGCYVNGRCDKCREQPIPADIAEKLGIKPVGGSAE